MAELDAVLSRARSDAERAVHQAKAKLNQREWELNQATEAKLHSEHWLESKERELAMINRVIEGRNG